MYKCPFCTEVSVSEKQALTRHIKNYHSTLNQSCRCPYDTCAKKQISTVYKYFEHVDKNHSTITVSRSNDTNNERNRDKEDPSINIIKPLKKNCINLPSTSSANIFDSKSSSNINFKESLPFDKTLLELIKQQEINETQTVVKLLADASLSRKSVQDILLLISNYTKNSLELLKKFFPNQFSNNEKSKAALNILENQFHKFSTEHKTFAYLKKKNLLIEPIGVTIGMKKILRRVRGRKLQWLTYKCQMHIVPMKLTLKKFLERPNVFSTIFEILNRNYPDYPVHSMLQGKFWKDIKSRSPDKLIIPLSIYFDDYEINNCIGSHRVLKKMGGVYFTIGCLPPEFSSKLENWFLAQIHKESDYKRLGNKVIFRKLKQQLLQLKTNGIEIVVDGTVHKIFFEVCKILGDNLGLNQILGFVTSFQANYYCRLCIANPSEREKLTEEDEKFLRNKINYAEDLKNLNDTKILSSRGVKEECIFQPIVDITELRTVDPTHDLNEGFVKREMGLIARELEKQGHLRLKTLNDNIDALVIDQASGVNKPVKFDETALKEAKFRLTASEASFLILYFGILIGPDVPEKCEVWKLYILLRKMYFMIMAPSFERGSPQLLRNIIKQHSLLFRKLKLADEIPKNHLVLHYPRAQELLGPLRYAASIRGEAVHSKFKRYAVVARSRKNATYTLSLRHQLTLAERFFENTPLSNTFSCNYKKSVRINALEKFESFKEWCPFEDNDVIKVISWAKYDGTLYKPGMNVVLEKASKLPVFGEIELIIEASGIVYFIVNKIKISEFNNHVQAYIVQNSEIFQFIKYENLATHIVFESQFIKFLDKKRSKGEEKIYETKKVIVSTYL